MNSGKSTTGDDHYQKQMNNKLNGKSISVPSKPSSLEAHHEVIMNRLADKPMGTGGKPKPFHNSGKVVGSL